MLSLGQLYTDANINDDDNDANDNDDNNDNNSIQPTDHACIVSMAGMPNEPKSPQKSWTEFVNTANEECGRFNEFRNISGELITDFYYVLLWPKDSYWPNLFKLKSLPALHSRSKGFCIVMPDTVSTLLADTGITVG